MWSDINLKDPNTAPSATIAATLILAIAIPCFGLATRFGCRLAMLLRRKKWKVAIPDPVTNQQPIERDRDDEADGGVGPSLRVEMVAMMLDGFDADALLRGYFFGCFRSRRQAL